MDYLYTRANRLEEPHSYMYTPFQGVSLLQSYWFDRMTALQRYAILEDESNDGDIQFVADALPILERSFDAVSPDAGDRFRQLIQAGKADSFPVGKVENDRADDLASFLSRLTVEESVTTIRLVRSIVVAQLNGSDGSLAKEWLDRLVQRFEVSKKIYEVYLPGFRKGEGSARAIRLYWLFALALCLQYAISHQIKYTSTLLKVCDLLCSLPESVIKGHMPHGAMSVVLATEMVGIQLLVQKKGVPVAFE